MSIEINRIDLFKSIGSLALSMIFLSIFLDGLYLFAFTAIGPLPGGFPIWNWVKIAGVGIGFIVHFVEASKGIYAWFKCRLGGAD